MIYCGAINVTKYVSAMTLDHFYYAIAFYVDIKDTVC